MMHSYDPKYKPGAPTAEVEEMDSRVVEGMECLVCGGKCYYWGEHTDSSYTAHATCNDCGEDMTF